ncbi:rRNA biogenesis protein rrp5 [Clostridium aquiflavi]|uniref:rRNA biogenesis protein rrp5 n=1 Tax=Clostridium aquiflavi TaxID=3073603 RepID=A0ABU1EC96_9CLOT|nr:rRNA biogenesis protein rrp5 [Clostridium sp. 5N-1]MDR5586008.1 rRNA biogenesis protein rrp5 [Clostridium sp. 5N-1]
MSKIKLLLDVVSDMRSLADSLQAVCDAMAESEPADKDKKPAPVKEAELKKTAKSADKKIKLEDVRAVLAEKSQAGLTAEVRKIIKKYGGSKLSEVNPKHYANILKDAEVLGNE